MKKLFRAKETFEPLYQKGNLFRIIQVNSHPNLMELECVRLKDGKKYGFERNELEEVKNER
ncbi:MAG: hypothetical protein ACP5OG_03100 [Candidatus Nanoarchaeia archaeon]